MEKATGRLCSTNVLWSMRQTQTVIESLGRAESCSREQWMGQRSSDPTSATLGGKTLRQMPRLPMTCGAISYHDTESPGKLPGAVPAYNLLENVWSLSKCSQGTCFRLADHLQLLLCRKKHCWVPHPLGQKLSWAFPLLTAFAT